MTCSRLERAEVITGVRPQIDSVEFAWAPWWSMGEGEEPRRTPKILASNTGRMELP